MYCKRSFNCIISIYFLIYSQETSRNTLFKPSHCRIHKWLEGPLGTFHLPWSYPWSKQPWDRLKDLEDCEIDVALEGAWNTPYLSMNSQCWITCWNAKQIDMPWQATDTQSPSSSWWAPIRRPHPSSHRKGNTKRAGSWDPKGAEICITYVSIVSCFAHLTCVSNIYKNTDIVLFGSVAYLAYLAVASNDSNVPRTVTNLFRHFLWYIHTATCFYKDQPPKFPWKPREAMLLSTCTTSTFGAWSCLASIQSCGFGHNDCSLMWMLAFGSQENISCLKWDSLGTGGNQKDWNHWNILYGYRMLSQF